MTCLNGLRLLIAATALGCASTPRSSSDSTAGPAHDASLHSGHAGHATARAHGSDSIFAAMQSRGALGMGVDQYTSTHTFESLPDGGRITLRRDIEDSAGVNGIRAHLQSIAASFVAGDFATPGFVHSDTVPGTAVMAARRALIRYAVAPIPHGGELIMQTSDPAALDAIHRFLAYQRREHRTGGSPPAR